MRKTCLVGALAVIASWAITASAAQAQKDQSVELYLGFDTTMPGAKAYLTLTFTANGMQAAKVVSEISFPKKLLTFLEAKRGEAAEQSEADLSTQLKEDSKNPDNSVLVVTVSAPKALPNGPLVNLQFQVASSAKDSVVKLKNMVKATTVAGDEIKLAKGNEGELTVTQEPVAPMGACFFFTH